MSTIFVVLFNIEFVFNYFISIGDMLLRFELISNNVVRLKSMKIENEEKREKEITNNHRSVFLF